MSAHKPSKAEDEFFAREEAELLRRQREKARQAADAAERARHHMKCPKDEHDLVSETVHGVTADRCLHCGGMFLDQAQVDAVVEQLDSSLIGRLVQDLSSILGRPNESLSGSTKDLRELFKRRRAQAHAEAVEALRANSYICPKDGHDMYSEQFHTIIIERCEHCQGIFLDANEVDDVIARDDTSQMGRFLRGFWGVLGRDRKGSQ